MFFNNRHQIDVWHTTGVAAAHGAVNGHYINWQEDWSLPSAGSEEYFYGPLPANPLVR